MFMRCKINVKNNYVKLLIKINDNVRLRELANKEFLWEFKRFFFFFVVRGAVHF